MIPGYRYRYPKYSHTEPITDTGFIPIPIPGIGTWYRYHTGYRSISSGETAADCGQEDRDHDLLHQGDYWGDTEKNVLNDPSRVDATCDRIIRTIYQSQLNY